MSTLGDVVREYPKATAAAVVVGVVVLYLLFNGSRGSGQTVVAYNPTDVQGAQEALNAQLQAQTTSMQTSAALQANADNNAMQIRLAEMSVGVTNHANDLQSAISLAQINAQTQTEAAAIAAGVNRDTLTAQVQNAAIMSETRQAEIASATSIHQAQLFSNALVSQAAYQAQTNLEMIHSNERLTSSLVTANAATEQARIQAQREQSYQSMALGMFNTSAQRDVATQSWLSRLFG